MGLRPREELATSPSKTQWLAINSSTMSEIVLARNPERRARSAREIGCRRRIMFSTTFELMWRGVRLDATLLLAVSKLLTKVPFYLARLDDP